MFNLNDLNLGGILMDRRKGNDVLVSRAGLTR